MAHPKKKISISKKKKRRNNNNKKKFLPILFYNKENKFYQLYHNIKIIKDKNITIYYKNKKINIYK